MMDWSATIQGVETLDRSRALRFRDDHADAVLRVLHLGAARYVAEIGCGPGALARSLARWLGSAVRVTGVDLDEAFVRHATGRAGEAGLDNLRFLQGDALALPIRSGAFDACLSYTVIEHLPNEPFLREQARICRPGGRVIAMMTLPEKSLTSMPGGWPPMTEREQALWARVEDALKPAESARDVGRHWPSPAGLPRLFEELGLTNVRVDALALPVVPDDARLTAEQRGAMIESDLRMALERIDMAARLVALHRKELDELRGLVNARFARRLEAARRDERVWDYSIPFVLVVSGQR